MNVIKDIKNRLLKRREVEYIFEGKTNPGLVQAAALIAQEFGADEKCIAVKSLKGSFGSNKFTIKAFIYDNAEDNVKFEPKPKEKKEAAA